MRLITSIAISVMSRSALFINERNQDVAFTSTDITDDSTSKIAKLFAEMRNIVTVGSCMIDFTSYTSRLPLPGETICGKRFQQSFGGKGANQCVAAAKLGASTTLVASLGSDALGAEYLKLLRSENVDVSYVATKPDVSTGTAQIIVSDNGDNSIVIVMGANGLLSCADVDAAADAIKNATVLLVQFESCIETTLYALKLHKGRGTSILNGAPAVENPDPEFLKTCDIFCVNETEAEIMTGIRPLSLSNVQDAIDSLLDKGCNTVIITLGSVGAVFATKTDRKIIHVPTTAVKPVDTTGAGDAFIGALAYFLTYFPSLSLENCITRATRIATVSVLKHGTQSSFATGGQLPQELVVCEKMPENVFDDDRMKQNK